MSLDLFIRIAETLGRGDEVATYRERLKTSREKIHERYYDPYLNSYLNGDQVRTTFALYAGIVPDNLQSAVLAHLEKDMTGEHPYFDIGTSRYPYFKVLFAFPQFKNIIANILSKTTRPGYGYFISNGKSAWPEYWEADYFNHHIHTSYTGISAWFFKRLAGIEPTIEDPAYRTIIIRPDVVENLTHAKATVESPYGTIESGWRKESDKVIYEITVPAGSKAKIYLPATTSGITESGQPLAQAKGLQPGEKKDGCVLIHAESGKYRFEVNL
jgi:alpha-L-rhamnosidase